MTKAEKEELTLAQTICALTTHPIVQLGMNVYFCDRCGAVVTLEAIRNYREHSPGSDVRYIFSDEQIFNAIIREGAWRGGGNQGVIYASNRPGTTKQV